MKNLFHKENDQLLRYPGRIHRELNIPIANVYAILCDMEKAGIVKSCLELHCTNCGKRIGGIYDTLSEIPPAFYCPHCECNFDPRNSVIVIYKVSEEREGEVCKIREYIKY